VLLSALSSTDSSSLTTVQVNAIAKSSSISALELSSLLEKLDSRKLIIRGTNGIDVLGVTSKAVLKNTSDAFDESDPSVIADGSRTSGTSSSRRPRRGAGRPPAG